MTTLAWSSTPPSLQTHEYDRLFEAATFTLREHRQLVVVGLWHMFRTVSLLPFSGYVGRAPFHDLLSIHPRFGIISFQPEDERVLDDPIYDTKTVLDFRRQDRIRRSSLKSHEPLTLADWEQAVCKRLERFKSLTLPPSSFVQIINPATEARLKRPIFGRMARTGPRPTCLFYGRGNLTPEAISALSEVEFLLVNVQGLRSSARIQSVAKVLAARGMSRPTLIVAASPSDLLLWDEHNLEGTEFWTVGSAIVSPKAYVRVVGRERLQAEKEFEFAFADLQNCDPTNVKLLTLAKSAWWASRQQLTTGAATRELKRFQTAYAHLESVDPFKAKMLTFGKELIEKEAASTVGVTERQRAVIDVALSAKGESGLLVITRNWFAADHLRLDLASEGWSADDLITLGVLIRPASLNIDCQTETGIAAGFFGPLTIDSLLASRAANLYFIVDPIELRALWFALGNLLMILQRIKSLETYGTILGIRNAIQQQVPAFVSELSMTLSLQECDGISRSFDPALDPVPLGHVAILLSDGTRLDVTENARFEVVNSIALRLETAKARDLQPGNEIILLDTDARDRFSDRLLSVIDAGPLAIAAETRQAWFEIVKAVRSQQAVPLEVIAERMKQTGERVNACNVRSWLPTDDMPYPCTPDSVNKFLAFAGALQIGLPKGTLSELYDGIRRWRDGHRKCGRYLARAIRGAYAGRLDATTLAKIERDWGMTARQLMQAAVLGTVEKILKAEAITHATD